VKKLRLYCFSPPVMIATFAIEICLLIYTFVRYKTSPVGRLAMALLACLAVFQLAEFNVCEGGWIDPLWASRIGYVAITLLPPLGIHLIHTLAGKQGGKVVPAAYASGLAFAGFFLASGSLSGNVCTGNYVIFQVENNSEFLYSIYYYGWLLAGMWLSWSWARAMERPTREALQGMVAGYAAFIVPTTAANIISAETVAAIPSIMCGFAVIFALVLAFWVMPRTVEREEQKSEVLRDVH
jgi:hypothetical protein